MKILYMGTPEFAVKPMLSIAVEHEIIGVITQPDKPAGRGKKMKFPPVKEAAIEMGIKVYQPTRIKAREFIETLKQIPADIFVVAAYGQILTEEILYMPKYGSVNIHASILPKYRGAAPIQWAIINGEQETGVTIMQMDKGIDTGDMLHKVYMDIECEETAETLHDKLSEAGASAIVEALKMIERGNLIGEKQDNALSIHAPMLTKEMGNINWKISAVLIDRLVRGLYPWPAAYSRLDGYGIVKILKARLLESESGEAPGTIIEINNKSGITVATGDKCILIEKIQLSGKKAMSVHDFLLGNKLSSGLKFY